MTSHCDEKFIYEKCREYTLLTNDEIQTIVDVAKTMPYLSEGLDLEIFIDIKVHDKDLAVVVAESYRKRKSMYSNSYMGDIIYRENEPAVFRTFDLGVTTKDIIGVSYDLKGNKIWTIQTVIPIFHEKDVVGTLIFEKVLELLLSNKPTIPEEAFLEDESICELLNSIFGFDNENKEMQVREGILIFDAKGLLRYYNWRADEIYQELGFKSIVNQHFDNLNYSTKKYDDIVGNFKGPFDSGDHQHYVIKKCFDGNVSIGYKFYHIRVIARKKNEIEIVVFIDDITKISKYKIEVDSLWVTSHEIHHRIKNNLQTVASLLRIQSRSSDDPTVQMILNGSINRILSIAATHELLGKNNNNQVSVKDLLDKIRENMIIYSRPNKRGIDIVVKGSDFYVESEKSTIIAAIVNELIQNSLKYAFPNRNSGCIEVITSSDGKIKVIEVKDNGVGYTSDTNQKDGLGLNIVKTYVSEKLAGKLVINTNSEGTSTSFAFKL